MTMLMLLGCWGLASAQASPMEDQGEVQLPLTLIDMPFNRAMGYSVPSMQQSLDVAWGVDRLMVLGVQKGFHALIPNDDELRDTLGLVTTAVMTTGLVFVGGWMHEEWHRAVMTSQGVSSRNGIYFPDAWSGGLIPVDQVTDEDLARIKRENPPQSVRLMSAGMEAEKALVYRAGDELFFHGEVRTTKGPAVMAESWMAPVLLMTEMSTLFYHAACVDPQMDDVIDTENHRLLETLERDFAGLDCTAWVYELKRPEQPYTDRGPHPYGVGVDRFVKWSDLADSEQAYLRQQLRLHWLNVLNPHLFGINGFMGGPSGARWIASVGHVLTPWGYTIDTQFGLIRDEVAGKLVLHNGVSAEGYFPGVDMEIVDQTLPGGRFALDGGIGIWLQPRDLRHDSCLRRPGGRLHTRVSRRAFAHIDMWGQMSLKSEGWVMGEVELGPGWAGSMGITGHL